MGKVIIVIGVIIAVAMMLTGCTYLCEKKSNEFYEIKIAEYFYNWPSDYIVLEDWDGDCRNFRIYSYDPDDPANANILGGWASGIIDTCGKITEVFYS